MTRWAALLLFLAAACGDEPFNGLLQPPPANDGMQLAMKLHVEPGEEITVCKNFAMPDGTIDIGRFEHAMSAVSHHMLVYQLDLAAADITDDLLPSCDESHENQQHRVGLLYGAQGPASNLELPPGIVFPARGGLSLQLEFHVFNASDEPADPEVAFNLWRSHDEVIGEAGMLFLYHNRIAIPPMSTYTARSRNSYPTDFQLMMLVPHMHSRGVAMQAFRDTGTGSPQQLFAVTGWENDTVYFDPPVAFSPGDVLDYHCDYDNQTADYIFDGFSAKHDEMCVTGGIYYRHGDRMAITDELRFGKGIVFTGSNSCDQIETCAAAIDYSAANWSTTPTPGDRYDLCMLAGCQAGADAATAFDNCRYRQCGSACYVNAAGMGYHEGMKLSDPACVSCVDLMCAAERDACPTATCP